MPQTVSLATDVVFVIIGRNEGERLRACIDSVVKVSTQAVYADSASSDGSLELARSLGLVAIEVVGRPLNAARGRNEGLAAARKHFPHAALVQFLDGDCVLQQQWPRIAAEFLITRPDAAVVCGRRFEARPHASFYNLLADSEWNTPIGAADACGGDSMIRIDALALAGGFNSELMAGEEPELCGRLRALGWTVWRLDSPMTEHDANILQFRQWWTRTVRSGFGYAQAWHLARAGVNPLQAPQLRSALFWVLLVPLAAICTATLLRQPWLLMLAPAAYTAQLCRIAARLRGNVIFRLRASGLLMIGKVAELLGAARYGLSSSYTRSIEYKSNLS